MKKLRLANNMRYICFIILGVIGAVSSVILYTRGTKETINTEEIIDYQYKVSPQVAYEVELQPSLLSEGTILGEDQSYIAEFVEGINSTFGYSLEGDKEAYINGQYEIVAQARGYSMQEGIKHTIWTKNYTVRQMQELQYIGKSFMINEDVSIDFLRHNAFAREVIQATKVNMPVEFIVTMQGKLDIQVGEDVIEEVINQSLSIPLGLSYFNITKEGIEPRTEQISHQIEVGVPIEENKMLFIAILDALVIVGVLYIAFGTEGKKKVINTKKQSKKVFAEYAGYLVGVEHFDEMNFQSEYKVHKMSDLIKVAEELEKPVLYVSQEEVAHPSRFYVVDEHNLYVHEIMKDKEEYGSSNVAVGQVVEM